MRAGCGSAAGGERVARSRATSAGCPEGPHRRRCREPAATTTPRTVRRPPGTAESSVVSEPWRASSSRDAIAEPRRATQPERAQARHPPRHAIVDSAGRRCEYPADGPGHGPPQAARSSIPQRAARRAAASRQRSAGARQRRAEKERKRTARGSKRKEGSLGGLFR